MAQLDVSAPTQRSLQWPAVLVLIAALAIVAIAYVPGLGGSLHFDDPPNLEGLADVADVDSAFRFVAEGEAGPLGRPLALLSFVPQAYAWPDAPDVFLYTNVCIHLLNGMLVAWLLYLLGVAAGRMRDEAAWAASLSAALWMAMPILASSTLLVVQRMTTLSATFTLLGLVAYLYARRNLDRRPVVAVTTMSVSVGLGTVLAALAKESGALLPLFVLVVEATMLRAPSEPRARRWRLAWLGALALPAMALLAYLAAQLSNGEAVILRRGFSPTERLLTETQILWQYLFNAFIPANSNLGPFHDQLRAATRWLDPTVVLAALAWLAMIAGAAHFRRRAPLFAFAVSWYLAGHALESTTIPLELYFEHRNYVPLIGPIFALVAATASLPSLRPHARSCLAVYTLLLSTVLFNTTSLWGQPALAGEMWAIYNPTSSRATQYLAQQLQETGNQPAVRRLLRRYLAKHPENVGVALQILGVSCVLEPEASHAEQIDSIRSSLPTTPSASGVFDTLLVLKSLAQRERCVAIDEQTIYDFAMLAASNPSVRAVPSVHHNLHVLMAEHAVAQRNLDRTMHHVESALQARYTVTTVSLGVRMLKSAGLTSAAERLLDEARTRVPLHPLRAAAWRRRIAELENMTRLAKHE